MILRELVSGIRMWGVDLTKRPFKLLVLHPNPDNPRAMRSSLMLCYSIQTTPMGGRAKVYVAMTNHPRLVKFVGDKSGVDLVIKNFEDCYIAHFDWFHVLLIADAKLGGNGTYIILEPMIPAEKVFSRIEGELHWLREYRTLFERYKTDIQKLREEYGKTIEKMSDILRRHAESVPSMAKAAEWLLAIRNASMDLEKLNQILMGSIEAGAVPRELAESARAKAGARRIGSRLVEAIRRLMTGRGATT